MVDRKEDETSEEKANPVEQIEESTNFQSASIEPKQVLTTDEELRKLQKEMLDYKDKYLRMLADSENARKRLQKEKQELARYAIENVIVDFLHPLDNLENALSFAQDMSDEVKNWAFGFQMILSQFKDILAQQGVTAIESKGLPFDPHVQEAIEMIVTDVHPPGIVLEELVRGYKMGDRMIRPARVKVSKVLESEKIKDENENI
jgi:molecular chaperone GrpE